MFVPTIISLLLRFLLRKETLPPSKGSLAIYIVTFLPAFFLSNYLIKIGTTRRDPTTGTLISYGEDLSQTGVTEWCFDILYVTCQFLYLQRLPYSLTICHRDLPDWEWCIRRMVLGVIHGRASLNHLFERLDLSNCKTDPNVCCLQTLVFCDISDGLWTLNTNFYQRYIRQGNNEQAPGETTKTKRER